MTPQIIPHNKPSINEEDISYVINSLLKSELTIGNKVKEFESKFKDYIGINAVATSSGTSALHLALVALSIGRKDEVILPSYTCSSVAYPVLYQNAKPILVDCDLDFNVSASAIESSIGPNTKALIIPHMFGYPADINEIMQVCDENELFLIEDCSQSLGSLYRNRKVGQFGDISIFSFYATKTMTSIQGGMLCSRDNKVITSIKEIRYPDQECSLDDMRMKYSYMMSDINAALGISQLGRINSFINRRREIARMYRECIKKVVHPDEEVFKKHIYSRYVIKTSSKEKIMRKINQEGIMCATMHNPPLHKKKIFFDGGKQFPVTEDVISQGISLPIYPKLEDEEVAYIIEKINDVV